MRLTRRTVCRHTQFHPAILHSIIAFEIEFSHSNRNTVDYDSRKACAVTKREDPSYKYFHIPVNKKGVYTTCLDHNVDEADYLKAVDESEGNKGDNDVIDSNAKLICTKGCIILHKHETSCSQGIPGRVSNIFCLQPGKRREDKAEKFEAARDRY